MRRMISLASVAMLLAAAFGGTAAAAEAPTGAGAFAAGGECSTEKQRTGDCLTFSVVNGEDPAVAAVRQTLAAGNKEQAARFAASRAKYKADASQAEIQRIVESGPQPPSATPDPEVGVLVDGSLPNNKQWRLTTTITFGYCNGQTCTNVDYLEVDYNASIFNRQEVLFRGELKSRYGWRWDLNGHSCTVHHEIPLLPDTQVGYFGECERVYNKNFYATNTGRSTGMVKDARNYVMVGIRFKPIGSDKDFVFNWESYHWYVNPAGDQWFY